MLGFEYVDYASSVSTRYTLQLELPKSEDRNCHLANDNGVDKMLKKLNTSKGDYCIKQ